MIGKLKKSIGGVKSKAKSSGSVKVSAFALAIYMVAVMPAMAQDDLCGTQIVDVGLELLTAVMQLGPLLAFISGVFALVMMGQVTSKDKKKKWKKVRNDAFFYGVFGVLIAGAIMELIMTIAGVDLACFDPVVL